MKPACTRYLIFTVMKAIGKNSLPAEDSLVFSCDYKNYVAGENVIPAHGLVHIFSGELQIDDGGTIFTLKDGDTYFSAKNNLFRFTKLARADRPLVAVSIVFPQSFLHWFYTMHVPKLDMASPARHFLVQPHPLWHTFFKSLEPYQYLQNNLPPALPHLKQQEAFHILRSIQPGIDHILSDFSAPGKIDLEAFMQKNFIFNLKLQRFAYLTGRSLSSFKRDFGEIFHTTPQRWLMGKRLELAHHLIKDKRIKPSSAYIEVGFENLSHFSDAFKRYFGYSPSALVE